MKKLVQDFLVVRNTRLNPRHFILILQAPEPLPEILPGQFVQVLVHHSPSTFLRRPFSVHTVNPGENTISLLIQIKGEGSYHLGLLQAGEKVNLVFPLGNSFSLPSSGKVLLIGGGCGVAPLLFLGQYLNSKNIRPDILVGFRTSSEVSEAEEYSRLGNLFLTTDDGSRGEKGLVTQHSLLKKTGLPYSRIYCCGPDAMMKAVAGIAEQHHIECEVSLENTMACGYGVCLCCVTPTDKGNERVCVEGPVFDARRLKW